MALNYLGLVKTSLVDFPGRVAATLFTYGCNLRCPYCHNANLVVGGIPEDFLSREEILRFLDRRRSVLDGVAITGGEPLLHKDLPELLREIRERGLQTKVDTNGLLPERIPDLDADYIAMDLKMAPEHYGRLGPLGVCDPAERIRASLRALRERRAAGRGSYELRTTVVPGLMDSEDFRGMAGELIPEERIVLAPFRGGHTLDPAFRDRAAPTPEDMRHYAELLQASGADVVLREQ